MESTFSYSSVEATGYTLINGLYMKGANLKNSDILEILDLLRSTTIRFIGELGEYPVASLAALVDGNTNKAREMAYIMAFMEVEGEKLFSLVTKPNGTNIKQNFVFDDDAAVQLGTFPVVTVDIDNESVTAVPAAEITEANADGMIITLNLSYAEFGDLFDLSHITLNNAPAGMTKVGVTVISPTSAELELAFDNTDFDVTVDDFSITIAGEGLTTGDDITSQDLTITALTESATLAAIVALTEDNLNGGVVKVLLTGETYVASPVSGNFSLGNAPSGCTIASINRVSSTRVDVTLAFNGTDFDVDVSNFNVVIAGAALSRGNGLTTNNITIAAVVE